MVNRRIFLLAIVVLAMVSIARADLNLTVNGVNVTKTLEITGKNNLVIAVGGDTKADANAYSISAAGGILEAITGPNNVSSTIQGGDYLFTFEDKLGLGIVSLIANHDMAIDGTSVEEGDTIYELILFYTPETDKVIVFGINLEALNFTPPAQKDAEQEIAASQTIKSAKDYFGEFFVSGTTEAQQRTFYLDSTTSYPDLNGDRIVNFIDFAIFATNWQTSGSGLGGDFDDSGTIDTNDLAYIAYYWLKEMEYVPDQILVGFKSGVTQSTVEALASSLNCSIIRKLRKRNVYLWKVKGIGREEEVINQLQTNPDVLYAERNGLAYPDGQKIPNDTSFNLQWNLHQPSGADINAPEGWYEIDAKFGRIGDPDIIIAIIDTGVDYNHPDLSASMWTDSSGHYGYDFVNDDNYPMDDNGHGTHVAGIAAAVTNNSTGVAGVSWGCSIMAVKVLPAFGPGTWADVADGIDYAVDNGANVINMSLGGYKSSLALENAVNDANVVMVAAAGNFADDLDVKRHYPAYYDKVICVSATDSDDQYTSFTNYGSYVDVAAPGKDIYSTLWNNTYDYMSGTSMATPHVSGLAALLLSTCPRLEPSEIKQCIIDGADDLGTAGKDDYYGWGRISVGGTFDYNVCDTNYFCADWSDSFGSASSCAGLVKVSDGCWIGAFENGQKAGEFVVLTYHACCGWHGWYGSSSCDYTNDPVSGKTWSKSLSCNGGTVQLTDDSTGAWEKINFTPTDIPENCCVECPCEYGKDEGCGVFPAGQTPKYLIVTFSGVYKCGDSNLYEEVNQTFCFEQELYNPSYWTSSDLPVAAYIDCHGWMMVWTIGVAHIFKVHTEENHIDMSNLPDTTNNEWGIDVCDKDIDGYDGIVTVANPCSE